MIPKKHDVDTTIHDFQKKNRDMSGPNSTDLIFFKIVLLYPYFNIFNKLHTFLAFEILQVKLFE